MTATVADRPAPARTGPAAIGVLVALVAVNLGIGAAGSLSTRTAVDGWYAEAENVAWNPPPAVFGPVWTALYVLMAVAAWLVWRRAGLHDARGALALYAGQLALNAAWTPVFFTARLPWVALGILLALLALLVATTVAFHRHHRAAAWLLGPYLTWVAYAATLNAGVAVLN